MLNYRISDGSNKRLLLSTSRMYYLKKQSANTKGAFKKQLQAKQQVLLNNQFQVNPATVSHTVNMAAISGKGQK